MVLGLAENAVCVCVCVCVCRCGEQVRYVIDFYNAPGDGQTAAIGMHLDVRPALDSVGAVADRVRMQFQQWLGGQGD